MQISSNQIQLGEVLHSGTKTQNMSWSNLFLQVVEDVLQVAKGQGGDEDTRIDAHGYACTDSS